MMFLLDDAVACYMMGQPVYKYETNDRASFTKYDYDEKPFILLYRIALTFIL